MNLPNSNNDNGVVAVNTKADNTSKQTNQQNSNSTR